ncbi:hypothetical protein FBU30_007523 [Linnemannia zychae]|nr:hypothetical protein FBU30_007523 [Linnemannia zychae]
MHPMSTFIRQLAIFHFLSLAITAQIPTSVSRPAYITINEEVLYIQGGRDITTGKALVSNQFFALDLAEPTWDTSKPPWKTITVANSPVPALTTFGHSFSISPDQKTLTLWDPVALDAVAPETPGISGNFSLDTGIWTPFSVPMQLNQSEGGLQAVAHPKTGIVYTPTGYNNTNMSIFDFSTNTISSATLPPQSFGGWRFYTFNWNELRQTFFLYGGQGKPGPSYFYEFDASKMQWTELITKGTVPPRLRAACMAPAYNGSKMVLFGGNPPGADSVGTLFILDVPTMTWSQGPSTDPSQNRSQMACTVSGDNFIAWGGIRFTPGSSGKPTIPMSVEPLIYNIYTGEWTTRYVRATLGIKAVSKKTSKNIGAIIGGAVGGIALLLVIAFLAFIMIRRRRQDKYDHQNLPEEFWPPGSGKKPRIIAEAPSTGSHSYSTLEVDVVEETHEDMSLHQTNRLTPLQQILLQQRDQQHNDRDSQSCSFSTPSTPTAVGPISTKYQSGTNISTMSSQRESYASNSSPTPWLTSQQSGNNPPKRPPAPSPLPSYLLAYAENPYSSGPFTYDYVAPIPHPPRHGNTQEYYQLIQNQLAARQRELSRSSDPQSSGTYEKLQNPTHKPRHAGRNHQKDKKGSSAGSSQELHQQISSLEAELNRLQAILRS